MPSVTCTQPECQRPVLARGLCAPHYSTWHREQKKYTVTCAHCGNTTQVSRKPRGSEPYCGRRCAALASLVIAQAGAHAAYALREQQRAKQASQIVRYAKRAPIAIIPTHTEGHLTWRTGHCKVCENWFTTWNTDVTCSVICQTEWQRNVKRQASERRRARKASAYVADVHRKKVFTSDNYRCHLCGHKTDQTKTVPHPKAPTIDHVIPLAAGGTHEPLNCRTACFRCNAVKQHHGGGEQLLLIAV